MLPAGFLGTRADMLMDLVLLSFLLILPAISWSWLRVRAGDYQLHKNCQLILAALLAVAVACSKSI